MRGMKIGNEYAGAAFGNAYATVPKAVFAALAFSLAMRLTCDAEHAARELLAEEWATLHRCGIVPQKPIRQSAPEGE